MRSLVRWHPAVVAFSDGFVGGMTGGASYRLFAAYFHAGWVCSWLQVLALALILGSFEAWRVARGRNFHSVRRQLVGILLATSLLWWSLAALTGATAAASEEELPSPRQKATLSGVRPRSPVPWISERLVGGFMKTNSGTLLLSGGAVLTTMQNAANQNSLQRARGIPSCVDAPQPPSDAKE